MGPAIYFQDIRKTFRQGFHRFTALDRLSLEVPQNQIFGFLGPNGAGKSTAIKILLNFIRSDRGRTTINGLEVGKEDYHHLLGYQPESPYFHENLTGLETLWFAGRVSGMDKSLARERSDEVLTRLGLEQAASWRVKTYSKGMKQRLGMAMALVHDPEIYILDEPMSGLDPLGRRLITDIILELRTKGKTVFFSSHILSDVERLCDRVGILHRGELLFNGEVGELARMDQDLEQAFIQVINAREGGNHE